MNIQKKVLLPDDLLAVFVVTYDKVECSVEVGSVGFSNGFKFSARIG